MTGSHACLENLRVTRTYKDAAAPQREGNYCILLYRGSISHVMEEATAFGSSKLLSAVLGGVNRKAALPEPVPACSR